MSRRAPSGGYGFARKSDYRRKIWATFRDTLKARMPLADAQAMLMPSLEGKEIETALNAGFRERNLHVVDDNPAIVATLKRRFPEINTYGVKAFEAFNRMSERGIRVDCANLDFCGQCSKEYFWQLMLICAPAALGVIAREIKPGVAETELFGKYPAFNDQCLVALTMLRGREPKDITDAWNKTGLTPANISKSTPDHVLAAENGWGQREIGMYRSWINSQYSGMSVYDMHRMLEIQQLLSCSKPPMDAKEHYKPTASKIRHGVYLSTNSQTFLWSVWDVSLFHHNLALNQVAHTRSGKPGKSNAVIEFEKLVGGDIGPDFNSACLDYLRAKDRGMRKALGG